MAVAGSTILKLGGRTINFEGSLPAIVMAYLSSPLILAGFVIYALAGVLWVYCLSVFDLSYVTFVSSVQYIFLLLVAILVFHEQISMLKWAGSFAIMIGVICWLKG
jgi:drug/metabolite transporter (DMT)-like permease